MILNLKEDVFNDIEKNGIFLCEGCACGEFVYKLDDNIWMNIYRSCRKSSMTPDDRLWYLNDVSFYDDIIFTYCKTDGESYICDVEEFGNVLNNVKLRELDENRIYEILKEKTRESWGNEFINGY